MNLTPMMAIAPTFGSTEDRHLVHVQTLILDLSNLPYFLLLRCNPPCASCSGMIGSPGYENIEGHKEATVTVAKIAFSTLAQVRHLLRLIIKPA